MSILIDKFNEKISKIKDKSVSRDKDKSVNRDAEFDILCSTGFLSIDYLNGTLVHAKNEDVE